MKVRDDRRPQEPVEEPVDSEQDEEDENKRSITYSSSSSCSSCSSCSESTGSWTGSCGLRSSDMVSPPFTDYSRKVVMLPSTSRLLTTLLNVKENDIASRARPGGE